MRNKIRKNPFSPLSVGFKTLTATRPKHQVRTLTFDDILEARSSSFLPSGIHSRHLRFGRWRPPIKQERTAHGLSCQSFPNLAVIHSSPAGQQPRYSPHLINTLMPSIDNHDVHDSRPNSLSENLHV